MARLPTAGPCVVCQKPYQLVKLDASQVQSLLQDATQSLSSVQHVISMQNNHYIQTIQRLREALKLLYTRQQHLLRQREEEQAQHRVMTSKYAEAQQQLRRLVEEKQARASNAASIATEAAAAHMRGYSMTGSDAPRLSTPRGGAAKQNSIATHVSAPFHTPRSSDGRHDAGGMGASGMAPSGQSALYTPLLAPPMANTAATTTHARGNSVASMAAPSPLGWSSSSHIVKRYRDDQSLHLSSSDGLHNQQQHPHLRHNTMHASGAEMVPQMAAMTSSIGGGPPTGAMVTPRTHAIASLRSQHAAICDEARNSAAGFRLSTPLAAALGPGAGRSRGLNDVPLSSMMATPPSRVFTRAEP